MCNATDYRPIMIVYDKKPQMCDLNKEEGPLVRVRVTVEQLP